MARAIWSGALTFGLVNVPVKLFPAVVQKEVRFHMLHSKDGGRIKMKRFCTSEDREVAWEEIVKGYEVSKGRYVSVTPEELEAFDPKATRTIEIHDFVELSQIDPIYYESTYYLAPEKTAAKAYHLLAEAMRASGKVAIATAVLRTRESLCCVRPLGDALALSTMNRADEIVPLTALDLPAVEKPSERELQMAEQLVGSLTSGFEPEKYPDLRRERVLELVERKAEGQVIEAPAPERGPAEIVSLADALAASLAASRGGAAETARAAREHRPAEAARRARHPAGKKRA